MKTIDEKTIQEKEFKLKSRKNEILLYENFYQKIALTPIEYKKYEIIVAGTKEYAQGSLF